jgi:hypothetical protein
MGIELSDEELSAICTDALELTQGSRIEYRRLLDALREKFPAVTYEAVATAQENLMRGSYHDDGQAATHAAFCCAWYQVNVDTTTARAELLRGGHADGAVFRELLLGTSAALGALCALAVVLNGGPLAQGFIDQGIRQQAIARATGAANARHGATNGATVWVQQQWKDHGHAAPYNGNKSAFARQYVKNVKAEFDVEVTAKTIAEVWLSPAALV